MKNVNFKFVHSQTSLPLFSVQFSEPFAGLFTCILLKPFDNFCCYFTVIIAYCFHMCPCCRVFELRLVFVDWLPTLVHNKYFISKVFLLNWLYKGLHDNLKADKEEKMMGQRKCSHRNEEISTSRDRDEVIFYFFPKEKQC